MTGGESSPPRNKIGFNRTKLSHTAKVTEHVDARYTGTGSTGERFQQTANLHQTGAGEMARARSATVATLEGRLATRPRRRGGTDPSGRPYGA